MRRETISLTRNFDFPGFVFAFPSFENPRNPIALSYTRNRLGPAPYSVYSLLFAWVSLSLYTPNTKLKPPSLEPTNKRPQEVDTHTHANKNPHTYACSKCGCLLSHGATVSRSQSQVSLRERSSLKYPFSVKQGRGWKLSDAGALLRRTPRRLALDRSGVNSAP